MAGEDVAGEEARLTARHIATDAIVPVNNALRFATALWRHNVECALHVFERGRHGLDLSTFEELCAPKPNLALAGLYRHGHATASNCNFLILRRKEWWS